ncbi:MAG TPA: acetylxylan esterase, partial [Abditibacteriaceae bacterium]|nr:acetylxylan esterase [Abditibacteriaceae bacterium]
MTTAELENFWQGTLQRLARQPMEAAVERVPEPLPYEKYRITCRSLDGVAIRAYLARPVAGSTRSEPLPAIISAPGYGGWEQAVMLGECQRGYIVLQVFPRSQGESAALWQIDGPDKLIWHLDAPEGYYYQGAYADLIRGVDYLVSRPDVDASRIGSIGVSQSGGMALAASALDHRIKAVAA